MAWKNRYDPRKYKNSQIFLAVLLCLLALVIGFIFWFITANLNKTQTIETTEITPASQAEQEEPVQNEPALELDSVAIQNVVDVWTSTNGGTSSVVVSDSTGKVLASNNPEEIYFAASIYKLYVAYAGYQQIDSGEVDPNEIYLEGYTRAECLDKMIRESYSPCAEKLWNELGKEDLTEQLKTYGINNTSMAGITTTAEDASILLARIARGEGLSSESQAAYLSSMKDQEELYRRGLPSGFSDLVVYNKVGWNEDIEWHDTAIIELSDGSRIIVSVMTENVGSSKISELGTELESVLTQ